MLFVIRFCNKGLSIYPCMNGPSTDGPRINQKCTRLSRLEHRYQSIRSQVMWHHCMLIAVSKHQKWRTK